MPHHHHIGGYTSRGCPRPIACLATIISMVYTSPGCRRIMPRRLHFDGLHLTGMSEGYASAHLGMAEGGNTSGPNDNTPALWCGGRRWPHRVQMRSPLVFDVGAEGGHIGSK